MKSQYCGRVTNTSAVNLGIIYHLTRKLKLSFLYRLEDVRQERSHGPESSVDA